MVNQFVVTFISRHNCSCIAILSWEDANTFIQYPCSPFGQVAFQLFSLHSCFFFSFKFSVMFSCFFAPLSCVSTFFNCCAFLLCLTGRSHISFQNFTISWLPVLMSLLIFSFSILFQSSNCAWFVRNILFSTYCCPGLRPSWFSWCCHYPLFYFCNHFFQSFICHLIYFPAVPLLFLFKALFYLIDLNG